MTRTTPLAYRQPTWIEHHGEAIAATLGALAFGFALGMLAVASWVGAL